MTEKIRDTEDDSAIIPFDYLKSKVMHKDEMLLTPDGISISVFMIPPIIEDDGPEVLDIQIMKFPIDSIDEDDDFIPDMLWMKINSDNLAVWMSGDPSIINLDYSLYEEENFEERMEDADFTQMMREHAQILAQYVRDCSVKGEIISVDDLREP